MSDRAGPESAFPVREHAAGAALMLGARNGDQRAWDVLVERYAPLIWSICRMHRLSDTDAEDVGRSVWLHLASELDGVRDPAALAGWLTIATRRECARVLRIRPGAEIAGYLPEIENSPAALREALTALPPACQQMISMLAADPPVPYAEISARLGIPVRSIGPIRARCLEYVRRHPAVVALIDADSAIGDRASATTGSRTCAL
jgi:RNA polymerase sigma factor (sigma-70 family)